MQFTVIKSNNPAILIVVHVPSQESEWAYMCFRGIYFASFYDV